MSDNLSKASGNQFSSDSANENSLWSYISVPINIGLLFVCGYLAYKIYALWRYKPEALPNRPKYLSKRDFTVSEMLPFNGIKSEANPEGRILVAICSCDKLKERKDSHYGPGERTIFEVTFRGAQFYGPGGPYEDLSGHDASRALASFDPAKVLNTFDMLDDIDDGQLYTIREWHQQFKDKYPIIGRLIQDGDKHENYSDSNTQATAGSSSGSGSGSGSSAGAGAKATAIDPDEQHESSGDDEGSNSGSGTGEESSPPPLETAPVTHRRS